MRLYRFNANGDAEDAATFDDTFVLFNSDGSDLPVWVTDDCFEQLVRLAAFVHDSWAFDYLAMWKGKMFPVSHNSTGSKLFISKALQLAEFEKMAVTIERIK